MVQFRRENVEDYYDITEEIGRYAIYCVCVKHVVLYTTVLTK